MSRIVGWIKTHKLTFVLLVLVSYFMYTKFSPTPLPTNTMMDSGVAMKVAPEFYPLQQEAPPATDINTRLVISDSYLSLLVDNVVDVQKKIIAAAEKAGGYMVESNLNNPQDAATATVVVRVPSVKLQDSLVEIRGLAVKVITENLSGQDVTDEFVDNQARLDTLNKTKAKFDEILSKATDIQDILEVQRELINLQSQIDSIKGQQQYLEKNAEMAKLTIYLSTDELALPYAPTETWRPQVILKQAIRSVLSNVRKVGTAFIWLAVYSIIWVPLLVLGIFLKKKLHF